MLGRGLEALIPVKSGSPEKKDSGGDHSPYQSIPLDRICPNPYQPRRTFEEEKIRELASSLREHGVLQPVVVTRQGDGYTLVVGERRWRAAKIAGFKKIPALVENYAESELIELALVENLQREDLNPLEEAFAYRFLIKEYGLTQEEVAERVAKSRPAVANSLRLLSLPQVIQESLEKGEISAGHARALLALPEASAQIALWKRVLALGLSVRQVEVLAQRLAAGKVSRETNNRTLPPDWLYLEEEMQRIFGTRVSIRPQNQNRGKLEIAYTSSDDLERIVDLIFRLSNIKKSGALSVNLL